MMRQQIKQKLVDAILVAILFNGIFHLSVKSENFKPGGFSAESLSFLAPTTNRSSVMNNTFLDDEFNKPDASFSACLLVMDENFRLQEWIAFAYFTLRLRYIVVTVDPRSKQLPTKVLDLFRSELNMTILEWTFISNIITDDSHLFTNRTKPLPETAPRNMVRKRHRVRQAGFYKACMKHLYERGKTWTVLYDADEFLVFNKYNHSYENGAFMSPPSISSRPGAVLDFIHQAQASNSKNPFLNTICYPIPRMLHGGKEISEKELKAAVPEGSIVEPLQLDTLRWRYHNSASNATGNGLAKVIIDVSRLKPYFPLVVNSPHRPVESVCEWPPAYRFIKDSPFRINHYLGSWEAYSYREDSRKGAERSREAWELQSNTSNTKRSDDASTWLKGFYKEVGVKKANTVLEGAGIPKSYKREDNDGWKFQGEKSLAVYGALMKKKAEEASALKMHLKSTKQNLGKKKRKTSKPRPHKRDKKLNSIKGKNAHFF